MAGTNYKHALKGRNNNNNIHHWKNTVEVYSNYSLMNTDHILDVAPRTHVDPGTGDYPSDYFMSYIFRGGHHLAPMRAPGLGTRVDGFRQRVSEWQGEDSSDVFSGDYGHVDRETSYSRYDNYNFKGVKKALVSSTLGHEVRAESTVNSFGSFGPNVNKGVTDSMPVVGQALPDNYDNDYGKNKVNEWRGTPSSRAL